jgi:hypothetical protein
VKPVRFTKSARKHHIGKAAAHYVMATVEPTAVVSKETGSPGFGWRGLDNRNRELEIIAIDLPDCLLVIHVMPRYGKEGRS